MRSHSRCVPGLFWRFFPPEESLAILDTAQGLWFWVFQSYWLGPCVSFRDRAEQKLEGAKPEGPQRGKLACNSLDIRFSDLRMGSPASVPTVCLLNFICWWRCLEQICPQQKVEIKLPPVLAKGGHSPVLPDG